MNYLSHFVFNHEICGLPEDAHFVAGVALPDLWPRFSRRKRIRWPALRAAVPADVDETRLQAGLLNHVAADARFHISRPFLTWVRQTKLALAPYDAHPAASEFLAHVAVELALDHHLVRAMPGRAERFYAALTAVDFDRLDARISRLGAVDAAGLAEELRAFVARRFAPRYAEPGALAAVLRYVLGLTRVDVDLPTAIFSAAIEAAIPLSQPDALWPALSPVESSPTDLGEENAE